MKSSIASPRLADCAPALEAALRGGADSPERWAASDIRRETLWVTMRDGVRLATDLYLPPHTPAPAVATRSPYGRARLAGTFIALAQSGYVVVSQDCRGTGDSEPNRWDYYVFEREDSFDLVEWAIEQHWCNGFLGGLGSSYAAQTQWCMALHPRMSTIVPEVGGLGIAFQTTRLYMFLNAYARSVGKGADKLPVAYDVMEREMATETLAGGYFNDPLHRPVSEALLKQYPELRNLEPLQGQRRLWQLYCELDPTQRAGFIKKAVGEPNVTISGVEALAGVFGQHIAHDAHMFPCARQSEIAPALHAPALMITGWYDWGLNDALATWALLKREGRGVVNSQSRLIISPSAHNQPGYHEGREDHQELERTYRTANILELLLRWYAAVRADELDSWPAVIYYLMGANEWRVASAWPPPESQTLILYLGAGGMLTLLPPQPECAPERYVYRPDDPTPTLGGSIVSYVYRPGSVDVSEIQQRPDVLCYTSAPLKRHFDLVGPLQVTLFASSSAVDTDFSARLSDVFPDGRAIQLQNGMLRARHRDPAEGPAFLEPGRIYRLEIDMWATANRFEAGHCIRLDVSSADFPRFDRNSNLGGLPGVAIDATQTLYHDLEHPSQLRLPILGDHFGLNET